MADPTPSASGITVYKYAVHPRLLAMARYGIIGGVLTGITLQLPAQEILRYLLNTPLTLLRPEAPLVLYSLLLITLSIGLLITLYVWRRRQPATGLRRTTVGALIGLFYMLTTYLMITSGVLGALVYRLMIPSIYEIYGFPLGVTTFHPFNVPLDFTYYLLLDISVQSAIWAWLGGLQLVLLGALIGRWWFPPPHIAPSPLVRESTVGYVLLFSYVLVPIVGTLSWLVTAPGDTVMVVISMALMLPLIIGMQLVLIVHLLRTKTIHRAMMGDDLSYSLLWAGILLFAGYNVNHDWLDMPFTSGYLYILNGLLFTSVLLAVAIVGLSIRANRRTRPDPLTTRILIGFGQLWWSGVIAAFISIVSALMTFQIVPLFSAGVAFNDSPLASSATLPPNTLPDYLDLWRIIMLFITSASSVILLLVLILFALVYTLLGANGLMHRERRGYNRCRHCDLVSHQGKVFCPYCGIPFDASEGTRDPSLSVRRRRRSWVKRWLLPAGAFLSGICIIPALPALVTSSNVSPSVSTLLPTATPIEFYEKFVISRNIAAGEVITEDSLSIINVPVVSTPSTDDTDDLYVIYRFFYPEQVLYIGQRAARDLYQDEFIDAAMLLPAMENGRPAPKPGQALQQFPTRILNIFPYNSWDAKGTLNDQVGWEEWTFTLLRDASVEIRMSSTGGDLLPVVMLWSLWDEQWIGGIYYDGGSESNIVTLTPSLYNAPLSSGQVLRRVELPEGDYVIAVTRQGDTVGSYYLSVSVR